MAKEMTEDEYRAFILKFSKEWMHALNGTYEDLQNGLCAKCQEPIEGKLYYLDLVDDRDGTCHIEDVVCFDCYDKEVAQYD